MTATNHTLMGVGLATVVANPFLLVVLAFGSHFVLDALPHFGMPGTKYKSRKFLTWLVIDITLMLIVIGISLTSLPAGFWFIAIGVGGAVLPDILHINKLAGEKTVLPLFQAFHAKIQWYERPPGILCEALFAGACIAVLF